MLTLKSEQLLNKDELTSISSLYLDVVIFNNQELFKIIECKQTGYNHVCKIWFIEYPISVFSYPPEIILNIRYKLDIEKYLENRKNEEPQYLSTFYHFLHNSKIAYIDAPILKLRWKSTLVEDISFLDYHSNLAKIN
jgi:hypothetical protein